MDEGGEMCMHVAYARLTIFTLTSAGDNPRKMVAGS